MGIFGLAIEGSMATRRKGAAREQRFWKAFTKYQRLTNRDAPEWYNGIRKAKKHEDQNGADFFLRTNLENMPEIPINVKASMGGAEDFVIRQSHGAVNRKSVPIPVGNSLDHFQCIRIRAFKAVEARYSKELTVA